MSVTLRRIVNYNKKHYGVEKVSYFFYHVPKCGGVSLVADLRKYFGLISCRGRGAISLPHTLKNGTLVKNWTAALMYEVCNFVNTEGHFENTLRFFPRKPRLVLMAREPVAQVVSIFTHCQDEAVGSIQKWNHTKSTLDNWISLSLQNKARAHICHMDPRDMQTTRVCGHDWKRCVKMVLEDAFFVAVLEYYDTSLCALFFAIFHGISMPHYCDGIQPTGIQFASHKTHAAHSSAVQISNMTKSQIIALTPFDHAYFQLAKARFFLDLDALQHQYPNHSTSPKAVNDETRHKNPPSALRQTALNDWIGEAPAGKKRKTPVRRRRKRTPQPSSP